MIERDPKAVWKPVPGVGTGSFEGPRNEKGLLHTTEGFSLSGAFAAYRSQGFAPHVTIGPDPNGSARAVRWQHVPFSSRSTTLGDTAGGIRPNRVWVWQVEIVGTCDDSWKTKSGGRYAEWHVDNFPGWYRDAIADLMRDWEEWLGIPRRSTVTFRPYPSSYGKSASQRLSGSQFAAYSGWLGHQHAPETTHGDPGDLSVSDLFSRMGSGTAATSQEEDDLTPAQAKQLTDTLDAVKASAERQEKQYDSLLKGIQTWGARGQAAGRAASENVEEAEGRILTSEKFTDDKIDALLTLLTEVRDALNTKETA